MRLYNRDDRELDQMKAGHTEYSLCLRIMLLLVSEKVGLAVKRAPAFWAFWAKMSFVTFGFGLESTSNDAERVLLSL